MARNEQLFEKHLLKKIQTQFSLKLYDKYLF